MQMNLGGKNATKILKRERDQVVINHLLSVTEQLVIVEEVVDHPQQAFDVNRPTFVGFLGVAKHPFTDKGALATLKICGVFASYFEDD